MKKYNGESPQFGEGTTKCPPLPHLNPPSRASQLFDLDLNRLELRTARGAHTNLTFQQLKDYVTAGDREICTGFVRPCRIDGQPASEWMPAEAFLAEYGIRGVENPHASALPPPLPSMPSSRPRSTASEEPNERASGAATGGVGRSFAALSSLPVVGRLLRWSERAWFEPQKEFTVMGGAEKLPLLATTFVNALEDANYPDIEIYRACEAPISRTMASFRVVKVSRKLFGHINAGCLSQVQLTADGPDLRVSVFSYPFLRVILRDFFMAAFLCAIVLFGIPMVFISIDPKMSGFVRRQLETPLWRFFSIAMAARFAWMEFTEESEKRLKRFRETQQSELAFIRSAVESSIIKATRDEALGIKENDIHHQRR